MADKLYLIIDSSQLGIDSHDNITVFLENSDIDKYSRVALKHVYARHESDIRRIFRSGSEIIPLYVHCSLLNKDDNLVNGEKSDVIAVIYPEMKPRKFLSEKLVSSSYKLIKYDNKICMSLTTAAGTPFGNKGKFVVIYELEFSWI